MNFSQSTEKPFYKKRTFLVIAGLVLLTIISKTCKSEEKKENTEKQLPENSKANLLKIINTSIAQPYSKPGYEDIKTYYYGVYLNYPKDTTGIEKQIMNLLKQKSENVGENEAVHFWVFTDSTLIPKSYEGQWSNSKMRKKCFGHAVKLSNGNFSYDYDLLGEFKP